MPWVRVFKYSNEDQCVLATHSVKSLTHAHPHEKVLESYQPDPHLKICIHIVVYVWEYR